MDLPNFRKPPVVEIVGAVQFVPVPQFGMREAVAVSRAFDGWEVLDAAPALEPIVESPSVSQAPPALTLGLGSPPLRVIFSTEEGRWLSQVQQDRIAAHERASGERPSFANVGPKVEEVRRLASAGLQRELLASPHAAEIVEVIYENRILAGNGWSDLSELHLVLRGLQPELGSAPYARAEHTQMAFSFALEDQGDFNGRLRVIAEPQVAFDDGRQSLQLRLISRRIVRNTPLSTVLESCHRDIVLGFTAVTTEHMHKVWERYQ